MNPLPHRHRCCLDCRQQSRHRWHCSRHCISTVFVPTAICSWGRIWHRTRRRIATAVVSTAVSSCATNGGDIAAASPLPSSLLLSAVEAQVPSPRPSHHNRRSSTAVDSCDKNGFEENQLGFSRNQSESAGIGRNRSESFGISQDPRMEGPHHDGMGGRKVGWYEPPHP